MFVIMKNKSFKWLISRIEDSFDKSVEKYHLENKSEINELKSTVLYLEKEIRELKNFSKKKDVIGINPDFKTRLTFDLVDKCNLACPSCYHGINGGSREEMDIKTCKDILDHCIKYFHINRLFPYNWSEPLLCDKIEHFINLFSSYKGMNLTISSNMNKEVEENIIKNILPKIQEFKFSVSALDQPVYEKYHKGGKINKVLNNIEKFLRVRQEMNATTNFALVFGRNLYNQPQEEKVKEFCKSNNIIFSSTRYYITDIQDVYKIYRGEQVRPEIYNILYKSYEDARNDILYNLTPNYCPLIDYDIVTDCKGNLMTCCATKIILETHITNIKSMQQIIATRLRNDFCRKCYEIGLSGYFRISLPK